jgi:hypothetical protein
MNALDRKLTQSSKPHDNSGGLLTFPQRDPLRYIFFGGRNRSPTDRPEHYAHSNGAEALVGVWLASDDFASERKLLPALGATFSVEVVNAPEPVEAGVARLGEVEIVLLPADRQSIPGRRIVGAILRTRDHEALRRSLSGSTGKLRESIKIGERSLYLPPEITHGIWLELRGPGSGP